MLVFRDAARLTRSHELVSELVGALERVEDDPLGALLLAAELECVLEDREHVAVAVLRPLTDALADAWLGLRPLPVPLARYLAARLSLPAELELRRPEGYAFYALDPAAYARAAGRLDIARSVCVVGVRSIGTSLSAVVRASLRARGVAARRLTVRPSGHPWARVLELRAAERELVERLADDADFVVVDEGPGRSGSTFLAVAEALERHGVPASRIRLLASRPIVAEKLVAVDAVRRFARYRSEAVESWSAPSGALELSGGAWRKHVELSAWPACWAAHERVKYLEPGARRLHKFSGLSRYRTSVFERAACLAEAGLAPSVEASEAGFLAYPWLPFRPAQSSLDAANAIDALAEYLAFRAAEFAGPEPRSGELESMTRQNVLEGADVELPKRFELPLARPVVCDGRMLPHEWLVAPHRRFIKTDGAEHGDDHFYPGPVDSAWDIAGVVVEWELSTALEAELVSHYEALTHDAVSKRLEAYKLAYAALRLGVAEFAAHDAEDDAERARWHVARARYVAHVTRTLARLAYVT